MFEVAVRPTRAFLGTVLDRRYWDHLIIHKDKFTKRLPAPLVLALVCGHVKGKLRCPENLTIVLIHSHDHETIMEKSLRYVGIDDFVVLKTKNAGPWRHTHKITRFLEYLESGLCKTEYILFADSDDAVLRDDPAKAITYLQEASCKMLVSSTRADYFPCMPDAKTFAERDAAASGYPNRFLNSGVFIGYPKFIREVYSAASRYVTDDDLTRAEFKRLQAEDKLCERLPDFPLGVGSDQNILRYLFPRLHPDLKIDYAQRLALR